MAACRTGGASWLVATMLVVGGARAQIPATGATFDLRGTCVDHGDGTPLAGVRVRLLWSASPVAAYEAIAETTTNAAGEYTFPGVATPPPEVGWDTTPYWVIAELDDRAVGVNVVFPNNARGGPLELRMLREARTALGRVVDDQGRPVAGARVVTMTLFTRPLADVLWSTTDAEGRFEIKSIGPIVPIRVTVVHPDFPATQFNLVTRPADAPLKLPRGCRVTGVAIDETTGNPAAALLVTLERQSSGGTDNAADAAANPFAADAEVDPQQFVETSADGRFQIVVPEGRYNVTATAPDRVCVAVTNQDCVAGETVELKLAMIEGGLILGRVVNTRTGEAMSVTDEGEPIGIGLFGPSQPKGSVIRPTTLAAVDEEGRFILRAPPGENYPYFVNIQGDRMAWDTLNQPAVVVAAGETTKYDMTITPPVPPEERLQAARELVAGLPEDSAERTARIIDEFRKLNHTVDECELWCTLMRELIAIGPPAVPHLCVELDNTTEQRMIRRMGFALRAIGDARAVPALVRAIPKTLQPPMSDYGLIVEDAELTAFMQRHDLPGGAGGQHFGFGRPVREAFGALHELTGQSFGDDELFSMSRSEDKQRAAMQARIYRRRAEEWQTWWEKHWQEFTDDDAYRLVNLPAEEDAAAPGPQRPGPGAKLGDGFAGMIMSPVGESGKYFFDLDTKLTPDWPDDIPRDESAETLARLDVWAAENGVDLMCVRHGDGETFVLRTFGARAQELSPLEVRNLDRLLAAGDLPAELPAVELLMHFDADSQRHAPDANGAFLIQTREGNWGLVTVTDRVTQVQNLAGAAGDPPQGVGFFKGVRFNWQAIIP